MTGAGDAGTGVGSCGSPGCGSDGGAEAHAARITATNALALRNDDMLLILLEALLALLVLVLIVWWTMFSGRPKGEPPRGDDTPPGSP